ncbi:MAG: hypothetical protein ABFD00_05280 [Chloroherpetonaceae bacterium]|nr:hypothetical protein [bacterium]
MKLKFFFFINIVALASMNFAFSQPNMKGQDEDTDTSKQYAKYIIRPKYPINLAFHYMLIDNTKFEQVLSDSTKREFERNMTYYFTFYSPGSPVDGFTKLRVSIDSLEYSFKSGNDSVYYNSQLDDQVPPFNIPDFDISSVILGKDFELLYSPYWDFGKVQGDNLIAKRNYINDPIEGIPDPIRKYQWNFQLSDDNLGFTVDLLKNLIPTHSIDTHLVRNIPFKFAVEGLSFYTDSAKVQLVTANSSKYVLSASFDHFIPLQKESVIPGFLTFVDFENVDGKGSYTLNLTPQGRVDAGELNLDLNLQFKDRNEIIHEKIQKHSIWQLIKNYRI